MKNIYPFIALALVCGASTAYSEDWTQWRGANRDSQVEKTEWPQSLDETHLIRSWNVPLGPGYSGPIVVNDRVFTTETRDKSHEVVRAFNRQTGEELWKTQWEGSMSVPFFAASNGSWIRSTPACDGEFLYVMGIREVLVALDVNDGKEAWRVDFVKELGSEIPSFGAVCSPLLDGDAIYVQAADSTMKLRKSNGEILWVAERSGESAMQASPFSSPVIADLAGVRQLVVQSRTTLKGLDLETGALLWKQTIPAFRGMNILTPLVNNNSVFTSTYGGSSFLFEIDGANKGPVRSKWETKQQGYMSSPALIDNKIYLHLRNQRFVCLDFETGEAHWTTTPFGKYWSMVANGNQLLSLDERGELRLIDANPEEYRELSSRKVSDVSAWAHVAVVNNQIFVRDLNSITAWDWRNIGEQKSANQAKETPRHPQKEINVANESQPDFDTASVGIPFVPQ